MFCPCSRLDAIKLKQLNRKKKITMLSIVIQVVKMKLKNFTLYYFTIWIMLCVVLNKKNKSMANHRDCTAKNDFKTGKWHK